MLRLIVVEDEASIRSAICAIKWSDYGFEVCGEAENGKEALDLIERLSPHLVFMDINLPEMNGIEAMRQLGTMPDPPAVILISAFCDFDYARNAIQFGALDYILKPFRIPDLLFAVSKAKESILKRINTQGMLKVCDSLMREDVISDVLRGNSEDWEQKFAEHGIQLGEKRVSVIVFTRTGENGFNRREQNFVYETFAEYFECEAIEFSNNIVVIIESFDEIKLLKNHFYDAIVKAKADLEISSTSTVSVGISSGAASPVEWAQALSQANDALRASFLNDTGSMFFYSDIEPMLKARWRYPYEEQANILLGIKTNDKNLIESALTGFLAELQKVSFNSQATFSLAFSLWFSLYDLVKTTGLDIDSIFGSELDRFFRLQEIKSFNGLLDEIIALVDDIRTLLHNNTRYSPIVRRAMMYIKQNYFRDISLKSIASLVLISPAYLSATFRQETGTKLNNFICQIRIENACKLLTNTEMKVYDVAMSVGFCDEKYFFSVFKKHIKMTPLKYRQMFYGGDVNRTTILESS